MAGASLGRMSTVPAVPLALHTRALGSCRPSEPRDGGGLAPATEQLDVEESQKNFRGEQRAVTAFGGTSRWCQFVVRVQGPGGQEASVIAQGRDFGSCVLPLESEPGAGRRGGERARIRVLGR